VSRFNRKKRADIKYLAAGGGLDLIDNAVKELWQINDKEFNYICKYATEVELDDFASPLETFSETRRAIIAVERLLTKMSEEHTKL